jgi:hypothetical protein
MANYGEEIAYWYLRLNGFFPIRNFIVHRCEDIDNSSDVDLIAVRMPYVFEDIGGHCVDWDDFFREQFEPNIPIGLLCEVKTGNFRKNSIFRSENVSYAAGRFGFTPKYEELVPEIQQKRHVVIPSQFQIGKILFSNESQQQNDHFFHISLSNATKFIRNRIQKYPKEKFADRMFFPSSLIQYLIDTNAVVRE